MDTLALFGISVAFTRPGDCVPTVLTSAPIVPGSLVTRRRSCHRTRTSARAPHAPCVLHAGSPRWPLCARHPARRSGETGSFYHIITIRSAPGEKAHD